MKMATVSVSPFSSLRSIRFSPTLPTPSPSLAFPSLHSHPRVVPISTSKLVAFKSHTRKNRRLSVAKAVEEETQIPQQEELSGERQEPSTSEPQPVVVPVSPSDTLTMLFQAEGTLNETAIPALTKALEETEGVANLKVQIVEGIASVELKKQTTVQATGVASSLVETIQGSGFKLQTLNLSFDEEDAAA